MRTVATAALAAILSGCVTMTADTVDNYSTSSLCNMLYSGNWIYNYEEEKVMRQALEDRGQACRPPTLAEVQARAARSQALLEAGTRMLAPPQRQSYYPQRTTCNPGLPDIWGNVSYTCSSY
jgi:hypothetical protein